MRVWWKRVVKGDLNKSFLILFLAYNKNQERLSVGMKGKWYDSPNLLLWVSNVGPSLNDVKYHTKYSNSRVKLQHLQPPPTFPLFNDFIIKCYFPATSCAHHCRFYPHRLSFFFNGENDTTTTCGNKAGTRASSAERVISSFIAGLITA